MAAVTMSLGSGEQVEADVEDIITDEIKRNGKQANVSMFAFTATPKPTTIQLFGRLNTKGHSDCCHILTGSRRMRFVNDNCKTLLLQSSYAIDDIGELLNGGSDNFRITVQRNCKVRRIALIIHYANQTSLVLHAHNGFLQLTVNNHTVCNDDDIIENNFIVSIVQRSQPVSQPCDGIRLAGTCAVLNQIVLCGMVFSDICKNTANDIKLVVAGENQVFGTPYLSDRRPSPSLLQR